jgi:hypothetical protein
MLSAIQFSILIDSIVARLSSGHCRRDERLLQEQVMNNQPNSFEKALSSPISRRRFLQALAATGALAALPGGFLMARAQGPADPEEIALQIRGGFEGEESYEIFRNACPRNITHYGVEGMMSSLGYTTRFVGTICWPAGIDAQNYDMGDMWCNDPEDMAKSKYMIIPSACSGPPTRTSSARTSTATRSSALSRSWRWSSSMTYAAPPSLVAVNNALPIVFFLLTAVIRTGQVKEERAGRTVWVVGMVVGPRQAAWPSSVLKTNAFCLMWSSSRQSMNVQRSIVGTILADRRGCDPAARAVSLLASVLHALHRP